MEKALDLYDDVLKKRVSDTHFPYKMSYCNCGMMPELSVTGVMGVIGVMGVMGRLNCEVFLTELLVSISASVDSLGGQSV